MAGELVAWTALPAAGNPSGCGCYCSPPAAGWSAVAACGCGWLPDGLGPIITTAIGRLQQIAPG